MTTHGIKARFEDIHSGLACGKRTIVIEVDGELVACIQPLSVEFYKTGTETLFIVQVYGSSIREWQTKLCHCWADVIYTIFGKMSCLAVDAIFGTILEQLDGEIRETWR